MKKLFHPARASLLLLLLGSSPTQQVEHVDSGIHGAASCSPAAVRCTGVTLLGSFKLSTIHAKECLVPRTLRLRGGEAENGQGEESSIHFWPKSPVDVLRFFGWYVAQIFRFQESQLELTASILRTQLFPPRPANASRKQRDSPARLASEAAKQAPSNATSELAHAIQDTTFGEMDAEALKAMNDSLYLLPSLPPTQVLFLPQVLTHRTSSVGRAANPSNDLRPLPRPRVGGRRNRAFETEQLGGGSGETGSDRGIHDVGTAWDA